MMQAPNEINMTDKFKSEIFLSPWDNANVPTTIHKPQTAHSAVANTHTSVEFLQKLKTRQAPVGDSTTTCYFYFLSSWPSSRVLSVAHVPRTTVIMGLMGTSDNGSK